MYRANISKTIENLKKRGFTPFFVENAEQASDLVEKILEKDAVLGFGGSVTIEQIGLLDRLATSRKNITLLHRDLMDKEGLEKSKQYEIMHTAPWFASSANAISETGEIINVDGRGNRVAKSLFGTSNYICIAGVNKIVPSVEQGLQRVREIAAPLNIKKLNRTTPCLEKRTCDDCPSQSNICRATVILNMMPSSFENFFVILINQSLGF